ncbi:uncharacterized protein LOC133847991 [Drosophila sulfurigaster albostrigata]|uniref:uncharacterized protein LOC133847991 n=1 Tax=Drosophila sulfurigaster albostrigata TaxID=89887 RepID=UPI002D21E631|nr:uncharacterized protein LOC133847991 [Drosophila sulfurigaster albostrigata]
MAPNLKFDFEKIKMSESREPAVVSEVVSATASNSTDTGRQIYPPESMDSVIKSTVNAAIAQAHETYRRSLVEGIAATIRDEIRAGFMEMMRLMQETIGPQRDGSSGSQPASTQQKSMAGTGAIPKVHKSEPEPPVQTIRGPLPRPDYLTSLEEVHDPHARNWRNPHGNIRSDAGDGRTELGMVTESSRDSTYLKLERWNVRFDGADSTHAVEDFVFCIEFLQRQYQCPWREVLRDFHVLLEGRAREWYWMHVRHSRVDSWMQLRQAMLDRFRGYQTEHDLMRELLQREQQSSESVDDYIHHMQRLASRFQKPLRDRELVKIIKRGLKEGLARYVYAMDILTVDELRQECIEVERYMSRRGRSSQGQQTGSQTGSL